MNSQRSERKRKRYNTFRASHNPIPPKRSFRRHLKVISSRIPHDGQFDASHLPVSTNGDLISITDRRGYTCFSSEENDNRLNEIRADDIILLGNGSDSSMEDKTNLHNVQSMEIGEVYSLVYRMCLHIASSNILKRSFAAPV